MPDFDASTAVQSSHPLAADDGAGLDATIPVGSAGTVDILAPAVSNVTPAEGTTLASDTVLGFDLTDAVGLALALVWVRLPNGDTEVVHDGTSFTERYGAESTRSAISGGWQYRLRRNGGWPLSQGGTLSVRIGASDSGGNVV